MTRYAYDPETFRLLRLRTDRYTHNDLTTNPTVAPCKISPTPTTWRAIFLPWWIARRDRGVSGNIEALRFQSSNPELAQGAAGRDALFRQFEYDPLYRLRSATGARVAAIFPDRDRWQMTCTVALTRAANGTPTQDNAPDLTALYRETYDYDPAGNMLNLRHQQAVSSNGGTSWETTWSRNFWHGAGTGGLEPGVGLRDSRTGWGNGKPGITRCRIG